MEIEFSLTKGDLIERSKWRSKIIVASVSGQIWAPKVFFVVTLGAIYIGTCYLSETDGAFAFVGMMAGVMSYIATQKWTRRKLGELTCSGEYAVESLAPQRLILTKDALINTASTVKGEYLWNGIKEILHTSTATFILMRNSGLLMVPHRIFKDPAEVEEFKRDLDSKWSASRWDGKAFFVPNINQ